MKEMKETQRNLNGPRKVAPNDASSSSCHSSDEEYQVTIPVEHKLKLLYSTNDYNKTIDHVPTPVLDLTNASIFNELMIRVTREDSCQYPSFYEDIINHELPKEVHLVLVNSQNLITDSLQLEIDLNSPQACDKTYNMDNNEKILFQTSFTRVCKKVCYKDKEFVHHIQLNQFATSTNKLSGFDYQIHYATFNKPDSLMFMTLDNDK